MINAKLKWMVTYWQEGFQRKMWILAVYHPGDKKAESLTVKNLLLKLWIIHIPYTVFSI